MALWSCNSILRRDETWLPERSAGLGERSGARSPVALINLEQKPVCWIAE
jgi:hypothetical protein